METITKQDHIGRNISRIRELRSMKQELLADILNVSQQTVSNIENSEKIEEDKLEEIAGALGVTTDAIKNFSEEAILSFFTNFYDSNQENYELGFLGCTFNPFDKIVELYERLLESDKTTAKKINGK